MFKTPTSRFAAGVLLFAVVSLQSFAETPQLRISDTVVQMPIAEGVSIDDAIASMKLRANGLNFKMVGHLPLYKELQAMGIDSKRIEIFQFCDARIAKSMIDFDPNFSAYLPCRITVLEDDAGQGQLITMNLGMFIDSANLPAELHQKAVQVRDTIASIMQAGAEGDL